MEEPQADLTWMLCRPYACLPPVKFRDHCQLAPTDLREWLQEQVAVPAGVHYEHRWGLNYRPSLTKNSPKTRSKRPNEGKWWSKIAQST